MNSATFFPAQFSSTPYPSTSDSTIYDRSALSYASWSCSDGFVDAQSSAWGHAVPLRWPHPESEPTSISDADLYETLQYLCQVSSQSLHAESSSSPTDKLVHPKPFPHEPHADPSPHPNLVRDSTSNTPYDFPIEGTQPGPDRYNVPAQHDALQLSTSQLTPVHHPYRPFPDVTGTPCVAPTLTELSVRFEHNLGPADDETTFAAALRPVRHTSTSYRANVRASSDTPYPYPSPEPEPYTHTQASSELIACRRRNPPALRSTATSSNRWKCPHCPYVQHNRRSPDLKRHVETHTHDARVAAWVCCGVPVEHAAELGVPSEVVCSAPLFDFGGVTMVGGCRKVFSRRDALIRHLRKRTGGCYGDAGALYQPGNRTALYG